MSSNVKCLFCYKPLDVPKRRKKTNHFVEIIMGVGKTKRIAYTAWCCPECTVDDAAAKIILEGAWQYVTYRLKNL